MKLIKTIEDILSNSIMENREVEYRILKKTFQNNTDKLYQYLKSRGTIDDFMLDIMSDDDNNMVELHRMIIASFLKVGDTERLYKYTLPVFSDLEVDGDKLMMRLDSRGDLSRFFYHDRDISHYTIQAILNGEHLEYDNYMDIDEREFEYYIGNLNEKNLEYIKSLIKDRLLGEKVTYEGGNEMLIDILTADKEIFTKDSLEEISRTYYKLADFIYETEDLSEIKLNFERIINYAHENAISDEAWDDVKDAVEGFFSTEIGHEYDTGKTKTLKTKDNKEFTLPVYQYKIDVSKIYKEVIEWWIDGSEDLDYWGDFETMLVEYCGDLSYQDALTFRYPEYADSRRVINNINDMFMDYIDD